MKWTDEALAAEKERWAAEMRAGRCPASGLTVKECTGSVCDCFIETHPDSPFDLHPEDFTIGRPE